MEIIVLIAIFALNVSILYFNSVQRHSMVMILNVGSLCLVVALAAMLSLLENILWILLAILTAIVGFIALRYYNRRKALKQIENEIVVETEMEEVE